MLWFLSIAAGRGFIVDRYEDHAVGTMGTDQAGRLAMTRVVLHPVVDFVGELLPTDVDIRAMHEAAHASCFIANSVRCPVVVEGR
jgi:organic hydroperoxide reductase OsmC/OhrA